MRKLFIVLLFSCACFFLNAEEKYEDVYVYFKTFSGQFKKMVTSSAEVDSTADMIRVLTVFKNDFEKNLPLYAAIQAEYGNSMYEKNDEYPDKLNKLIDDFTEFTRSEEFMEAGKAVERYREEEKVMEITQEIDFMINDPEGYLASKIDYSELEKFFANYYKSTQTIINKLADSEASPDVLDILKEYYTILEKIFTEAKELEKKYPGFVFDDNMDYDDEANFPEEIFEIIDEFRTLVESERAKKAEEKLELFSEVKEITDMIWKIEELRPK